MSNRSSRTPAPLVLELRPSRWLRRFRCTLYVLALVAWFAAAAPAWIKMLAAAGGLALLAWEQSRPSPRHLRAGDTWVWCGRDGIASPLLLSQSVVWPALIVLYFHHPWRSRWSCLGRRSLVLLPDSLDADDWRRLRIALGSAAVYAPAADAAVK